MEPFIHFPMPIEEVSENGVILSKTGAITIGFEIAKAAITRLTAEQQEAYRQDLAKALSQLPAGTTIHFQDRYAERRWEADAEKDKQSFLDKASDGHFAGRGYLESRAFAFFTLPPSSSGTSLLTQQYLTPAQTRDPKLFQEFEEKCTQAQAILNDQKHSHYQRLTAEEITGTDNKAGIIEEYIHLPSQSNQPVIGDIAFTREGVRIHDRPSVIYTLADAEQLPATCGPFTRLEAFSTANSKVIAGFASPLGPLLHIPHIYNLFLFREDPDKLLAALETRRRRLKSLSGQSRENAVAAEDIGRYLQEAAESQRHPVRVHANVMAWGDDIGAIALVKQTISSAISRMGITPHLETVGAPQIWYAGIPGNACQLPPYETWLSFLEQASCFVINETTDLGSDKGFGIQLVDRHSGRPLLVDPSDLPMRLGWTGNRNKFVLGSSGSGKSYLMLLMTRCYYASGAHILLIDVGGSYKRLCRLLKGLYFSYSAKSPIRFNPFRLDKGEMPDIEKKESLKTLLVALWKRSGEPFRRSEYVALSNALHSYYENLAVPACFNSFYDYLRVRWSPELAKEKVKPEDFDLDNFLYVLKPYYQGGEYDYLLNAMDQPSLLQERLIVFDIDEIKDHPILFPVVTIIIMDVFISKMRQLHGVRKVIIIEEAWKAIAKEGMDEAIKYLFKTVRKFFGEAIVVTQEIEDIISSPVIKNAILNNADTKILLDQSKFSNRFDTLQEILGLTDHDKGLVLSLNKVRGPHGKSKEVFIGFANGPSSVYRVEVSLEEHLAYTSEESERVLVEKYAEEAGDLEKGIAKLAAALRLGAVKLLILFSLFGLALLVPSNHASAQVLEIAGLINAAVKKVITAADLQVQRLQTETIALQDAEKALENQMAGDLLGDITDWVQDQEELYGAYYQELWQVKTALSDYSKTAMLVQRQIQLIREEQQDWSAVQRDPHFSLAELNHIGTVYSGILNQSVQNVQQIEGVIQSFITQMDDAGRLRIIDETNAGIDENFQDLRQFTQENSLLSLQRAKDENDILTIKTLYNLP